MTERINYLKELSIRFNVTLNQVICLANVLTPVNDKILLPKLLEMNGE